MLLLTLLACDTNTDLLEGFLVGVHGDRLNDTVQVSLLPDSFAGVPRSQCRGLEAIEPSIDGVPMVPFGELMGERSSGPGMVSCGGGWLLEDALASGVASVDAELHMFDDFTMNLGGILQEVQVEVLEPEDGVLVSGEVATLRLLSDRPPEALRVMLGPEPTPGTDLPDWADLAPLDDEEEIGLTQTDDILAFQVREFLPSAQRGTHLVVWSMTDRNRPCPGVRCQVRGGHFASVEVDW